MTSRYRSALAVSVLLAASLLPTTPAEASPTVSSTYSPRSGDPHLLYEGFVFNGSTWTRTYQEVTPAFRNKTRPGTVQLGRPHGPEIAGGDAGSPPSAAVLYGTAENRDEEVWRPVTHVNHFEETIRTPICNPAPAPAPAPEPWWEWSFEDPPAPEPAPAPSPPQPLPCDYPGSSLWPCAPARAPAPAPRPTPQGGWAGGDDIPVSFSGDLVVGGFATAVGDVTFDFDVRAASPMLTSSCPHGESGRYKETEVPRYYSCEGLTDCGAGHFMRDMRYTGHTTSWQFSYRESYEVVETLVEQCGRKCSDALTPTRPPARFPARIAGTTPPDFPGDPVLSWRELPGDPADWSRWGFGSRPIVDLGEETFEDLPFPIGWTVTVVAPLPLQAQGATRPAELQFLPTVLTCDYFFDCSDPSMWPVDADGRNTFEIRPRPLSSGPSIVGRVRFHGLAGFEACSSSTQAGCDFYVPEQMTHMSMLSTLPTLRALVFSPPSGLQAGLHLKLETTTSKVELWHWKPATAFVGDGTCNVTESGCIENGENVILPGQQVAELNKVVDVPARLVVQLPDGRFFAAAGAGSYLRLPVTGTVGR